VYLHQRMYAALCALNHDLVLVTHVNCYYKVIIYCSLRERNPVTGF